MSLLLGAAFGMIFMYLTGWPRPLVGADAAFLAAMVAVAVPLHLWMDGRTAKRIRTTASELRAMR